MYENINKKTFDDLLLLLQVGYLRNNNHKEILAYDIVKRNGSLTAS